MLDHGKKWMPVPDWPSAEMALPGLAARSAPSLSQHLVSGNLGAALRRADLAETVGAWGVTAGGTYAVRLAFDRLLLIGSDNARFAPGWDADGFAVTNVSAGYHVFELDGPSLPALVARGTSINLADPGPSAVLLFAGFNVILYRHGGEDRARLHCNRAQAAALWTWIGRQDLA